MIIADTIAASGALREGRDAGISYLRSAGAGAGGLPFVLLHGIGSNASSFAPLMRELGELHPSLAWDAPGYGGSNHLAAEWPSAGDYADALDRLLSQLGIARAILLGHSLGALVAARFAASRPGKTAGVILVSPATGYGATPGAALPDTTRARLEELTQFGPEKFAARRAPRLVSAPAAMPDVLAAVERAMAAVDLRGYTQATRMLACGNVLDDVARLAVPALVICGGRDAVTPPDQAMRVAGSVSESAKTGNGDAVILPAAGHALPQEQPAALAALVRVFAGGPESMRSRA